MIKFVCGVDFEVRFGEDIDTLKKEGSCYTCHFHDIDYRNLRLLVEGINEEEGEPDSGFLYCKVKCITSVNEVPTLNNTKFIADSTMYFKTKFLDKFNVLFQNYIDGDMKFKMFMIGKMEHVIEKYREFIPIVSLDKDVEYEILIED